ncbi:MAG: ABC transporter ATP-binding protein [Salinigranum sp.]
MGTLLTVDGLTTRIYTEDGILTASNDTSFHVDHGEVFGIVGESGSGKTITAMSVMNLIEPPARIESGTVRFKGRDVLNMSESELDDVRGNELSMVFQDPSASLNPVYTIGFQIARVIRRHRGYRGATRRQELVNRTLGRDIDDTAREEAIELMRQVKIPDAEKRYSDYPHEFSGGMRQRALIAMGLACQPDLLIADEITTGLDVTTQSEIFDLLNHLREAYDMSIVLITHDLAAVAETCDRVAVMYAGNVVETGTVEELFTEPAHPYTLGLLESVPRIGGRAEKLQPISGTPPEMTNLPEGCNFRTRCPFADSECRESEPPLAETDDGRAVACFKTDAVERAEREVIRE